MLKTVSSVINAIGALNYQGTWDAATNTPTLTSSVGTKGDYYVVSVAGSTNLDGTTLWGVGDWAVFNGSIWQKVDGGSTGDFTNLSVSGIANFSGQLASSVMFLNASKNLATDSSFSYDGVTQTLTSPKFNVSGGTANGVPYLNASKVLTTGTALTFDGTNFGVGTTTPASILDLKAGANTDMRLTTTGTGYLLIGQYTNGGYIGTSSYDALRFGTAGSEQMRLTSTGLGIGTSSLQSGTKLTLQESATNPAGLAIRNRNSTQTWQISVDAAAVDDKILAFIDPGAGAVRMSLDSSGNLGIGTSSPSYRLDVQGGTTVAQIRSTTTTAGAIPKLRFNHAGNDTFSIVGGSYMAWLSSDTTERMRLDSSGNLGIGTNSPYKKLEVVGSGIAVGTGASASNLGIEILGTQNSLPAAQIRGYIATGDSNIGIAGDLLIAPRTDVGANIRFITGTTPTERARIDSSGNLGLGVTPSAWNTDAGPALQVNYASLSQAGGFDVTNLATNAYLVSGVGYKYIGSASATMYQQNGGGHRFFTAPSGTAGDTITFTQAMTLDASGKWQLGTTSASAFATVVAPAANHGFYSSIAHGTASQYSAGIFERTASAGNLLQFQYSGSIVGGIATDNTNVLVNSQSALIFGAGSSTERARIDSSGNLLVGTTTAGASKLVVNSDSIQVNTAKTPASATATGTTGQIAWDANYIYVCTATNTWKRVAIATW